MTCTFRNSITNSSAAPADVDSLVMQLKNAAKSIGLPADTAESWLKNKAKDGKTDIDAMVSP
jgi:hypothetical protein